MNFFHLAGVQMEQANACQIVDLEEEIILCDLESATLHASRFNFPL